jgi:phosphoglycolate phosphatase-like HAD superfamily hydrolase
MIKAVIFDIDGTLMDTNGLHIIAWERAVAIGDTPYDMIAARKLGLPCVAVLSGGSDRQQLEPEGPVAIFTDVAELQAHLDELVELRFDKEQR